MTQIVSITIQATGEGLSIIEAIKKDNPGVTTLEMPGVVKLDCPGELIVKRETVSESLGRDWDPQEIHLSMVSISGNLDEDDDYFALSWT